jgi:hypothetical protein
MTPYCNQLINYVEIEPKEIIAADKGKFHAIGRGDMKVTLPNGPRNTTATILLKDVLYAPKLGVTLVSISKVAGSGCTAVFHGDSCKILNQKKKLLGSITVRNGLYRVEHEPEFGMAAVPEKVTVDELHRRMGHIAPEAARRLVKAGLVEGIELDESEEPKSCDSCAYAKTTRKAVGKERERPRAKAMGDEIHSDLWGPAQVRTPQHKEY